MKQLFFAALLCCPGAALNAQNAITWGALDGHTLVLNDIVVALSGVECPASTTDTGLEAKRVANTFLRGGRVVCQITQAEDGTKLADCSKSGTIGLTLSQVLLSQDLCKPIAKSTCITPAFDALPLFTLPPNAGRPGDRNI